MSEGGGPKFRIVQGKPLGESRSSSSAHTTQPSSHAPQPQPIELRAVPSPQLSQYQNQNAVQVTMSEPLAQEVTSSQPRIIMSAQQPQHHQQIPTSVPMQQMSVQMQHPTMQDSGSPGIIVHQIGGEPAPIQHTTIAQQQHTPIPPAVSAPNLSQPRSTSTPTPSQTGTAGAATDEQMVIKCVRFFKTLIQLSQQPDQQQGRNTSGKVRELVSGVIYGVIPAEEFTVRLQEALRSQAQPHLLPFLQKTLPYLRSALQNGEVTIEGVTPPPGALFSVPLPLPTSIQSSEGSAASPGLPISMAPATPQSPAPESLRKTASPAVQQLQMSAIQHGNPQSPHQMVQGGPKQQPTPQHLQPQQQHSMKMEVDGPATSSPEVFQGSATECNRLQPPNQQGQPPPQGQFGQPGPPPQGTVPMEQEPLPTRQLTENALRSVILRPEEIMKKITQKMAEACFVDEELLTLVSDATEYRLRELITELGVVAEHRLDNLKLNPNYTQIDDTKAQLKWLENLDRQQEELRENREKEQIIRMSKSKGIAKDTLERAKEMQRADAEAKRNRDANAAAIAALGGSKSKNMRWDSAAAGGVGASMRPRTIRVNLRDLHAVVAHDPRSRRSNLLHKLALSAPQTDNTL